MTDKDIRISLSINWKGTLTSYGPQLKEKGDAGVKSSKTILA